ncbi:hypothetical protein BD560DRAFT_149838 [Blakeslea trispora]|nr:hypothetical protein BD560DRAFT_149838 [Blakeslea trispora]
MIPPLPNISSTYQPQQPIAKIHTQQDIDQFVESEAFKRLMTFVALLNQSVTGKKVSDDVLVSSQTQRILDMLTTLEGWVDAIEPCEQPQRFGNKAFRQFIKQLEESSQLLQQEALASDLHQAIPELSDYLIHGFGNATRIDYGSGHELSFVAWLAGIALLGGLGVEDYEAIVLRIFVRYLELVRKIQKRYTLEPAGSHGVWGLDDHQFLPYVWGSAQLINHPQLQPKSIQQPDLVHQMARDYLYFRSIEFILEVKRGPFFEHSPMLNDIASVASWSKVNTGMTKMFMAEVLKKVPVVQHFRFGCLFPF